MNSMLTDNLALYHAHREEPLLFRKRTVAVRAWTGLQRFKRDMKARFLG